MVKLGNSFDITLVPVPPYNFALTVRNPAGWSLFTPFEKYEEGVMWTSANIMRNLLGFRISSSGNLNTSSIKVRVFSEMKLSGVNREKLKGIMARSLGTEQELAGFYEMAAKDDVLKYATGDLFGMHDRFPATVFPEAVLAILLQMAPLKRSNEMMASFIKTYGELAEFDGREILAWPVPERMSQVGENEVARRCKVGYRAKYMVRIAQMLAEGGFPSMEDLLNMEPGEAKKKLMELPGIGDYSSDIINPHGGFPIDVWSAEVFSKIFFGRKPQNNRSEVEIVKKEGIRRWGKWAWMAFFYIVQDLPALSEKLGIDLRLT